MVKQAILLKLCAFTNCFLFFAVPPSKPAIRLADTGQSVEGYLGPYQIGTRLSLVCQVNGGKNNFPFFGPKEIERND